MKTHTPLIFIIGNIAQEKTVHLKATPGYRTLLYIIKGEVTVNDRDAAIHNLIVFEKENDEISW